MKSRETKQTDLNALTASLAVSKSAMIVSFKGVSVAKDQEFRNSIREAGAKYEVVKNTLARIAVKGTDFEQASEHFKGVTAIALRGAIDLIAEAGGGSVEGYPHDTTDGKKVSVLYNATRSLYEGAGFDYLRPKGKRNCVMRRVVS